MLLSFHHLGRLPFLFLDQNDLDYSFFAKTTRA